MHSTVLLCLVENRFIGYIKDYDSLFSSSKIHRSSSDVNMHSFEGGSPWITMMTNTDLKEQAIDIFLRGNLN